MGLVIEMKTRVKMMNQIEAPVDSVQVRTVSGELHPRLLHLVRLLVLFNSLLRVPSLEVQCENRQF